MIELTFANSVLLYFSGAILTVFISNIWVRYHAYKKYGRKHLTGDDVDAIILCTLFWFIVIPLMIVVSIVKWTFIFIDKTAIAIVNRLVGEE